jgi:peptide/nickel transport system permease protein
MTEMQRMYYYFFRKRLAVFGLILVLTLLLIAIFAPLIAPNNPHAVSRDRFLSPGEQQQYPLGTDNLGRCVLSGMIYGARVSLFVGLAAALTATISGILVGAISGYFGGVVDAILMRITELFMTIPRFVLALIVVAFFGSGLDRLILVIGLLSWPGTARLVRSEFLSHRRHPYVESGRVSGMSHMRIIFGEILPNIIPPVIVVATLDVATAILLEASLGFFGLGDPNLRSWGGMLSRAQSHIRTAWWMSVFPGSAIALTVLGFNLIGDGLNEATNPRLQVESGTQ